MKIIVTNIFSFFLGYAVLSSVVGAIREKERAKGENGELTAKESSHPITPSKVERKDSESGEGVEFSAIESFEERLEWIESKIKNSKHFSEWSAEFRMMAKIHPEALLYLLDVMDSPYPRHDAQGTLLYEWAILDYAAADSWLGDNFEGLELQSLKSGLIAAVIDVDTRKASALIADFSGGHTKNELVSNLVRKLFRDNPASSFEWINSNLVGLQKNIALNAIGHYVLSGGSLDDAFKHLERFTPGTNRSDFLGDVARKFAEENPEKAIEWFHKNDLIDQKEIFRDMLSVFTKQDSDLALNFVKENGASNGSDMVTFLEDWGRDLPVDALRFIDNEGEFVDDLGVKARERIVHRWGEKEPAKAAEYVRSIQGKETQAGLLIPLTASWSSSDPQAAADFLLTFEPDVSEKGIITLTAFWSQFDSLQAGEWIRSLEPGRTQDTASARFAREMVKVDPVGAVEWGQSISNPVIREETLNEVLKRWRKVDPQRAALFEAEFSN